MLILYARHVGFYRMNIGIDSRHLMCRVIRHNQNLALKQEVELLNNNSSRVKSVCIGFDPCHMRY